MSAPKWSRQEKQLGWLVVAELVLIAACLIWGLR